jgi:nitroimidazol reductase NimA-like FMN-containing flavoprotein (pyridoxamine 5'-phosphate oxidase superfamily)
LDSVRANDKVSFTVIDKGASEENSWVKTYRSVIAFGRIEVIDDLETIVDIATKLSYKFTSDKAYIEGEIARFAKATLLLKLKIEHLTGKKIREE